METFSVLLAICVGNSPVTGELPSQRPATRTFDVYLICSWVNSWVNNDETGDLRRHRAHYDVKVIWYLYRAWQCDLYCIFLCYDSSSRHRQNIWQLRCEWRVALPLVRAKFQFRRGFRIMKRNIMQGCANVVVKYVNLSILISCWNDCTIAKFARIETN